MNWQAWDIQPPPEGALVKFKDEITKLQWIGTSYDIGQESTKYLWWIKTGIQSMEDECRKPAI